MTTPDFLTRLFLASLAPALYAIWYTHGQQHFWGGSWHTYLRLYWRDAAREFICVFLACLLAEFLLFQLGVYLFRPTILP